jgi:hypothetical protein
MPSETELHGTATGTPVPVAFVSSNATRGGAERYLALLLEHLPDEWIRRVAALAACGRERFERLFRWSTLVDEVADRYRLVATEATLR